MPSIFSPEKRSWFISLLLSIVYFITFLLASKTANDGGFASSLLFGFCVWGFPDLPNKDDGCSKSPVNSHLIAFAIDVLMTIAAYVFYKKDESKNKQGIVYFANGSIILLHGALHFFLTSPIIDCYEEIPADSDLEDTGYLLYGIFTFFLCLIILGFGNQGLSLTVIIQSAIFTAVVQLLTKTVGNGEFVLTGLFCVVHPLSSYAGLTTESPLFSSTVGWWFVVATIAGILELSTCPSFFRAIGGHFYYDLTLHIAVLYSLPYFVPKGPKDSSAKKMK